MEVIYFFQESLGMSLSCLKYNNLANTADFLWWAILPPTSLRILIFPSGEASALSMHLLYIRFIYCHTRAQLGIQLHFNFLTCKLGHRQVKSGQQDRYFFQTTIFFGLKIDWQKLYLDPKFFGPNIFFDKIFVLLTTQFFSPKFLSQDVLCSNIFF